MTGGTTGEAAVSGYVHEAVYVDSPDGARTTVAPFLSAGLEQGEPVVLACTEPMTELLLRAVDDDPRVIVLSPGTGRWRSAAQITACQEMMEGKIIGGESRVRLVAEPTYWDPRANGPEPGRVAAAANHVLGAYPLWSLCLYDTARLPSRVVTDGMATHPRLRGGTACGPNEQYVDPVEFLRCSLPAGPDPLEATPPVCEIDDLSDLQALRGGLLATVGGVRHDAPGASENEVVQDFVVAVNEVATNALRHGRPPVDVRVWSSPERIVCTVCDRGSGVVDPLAGYVSPEGRDPAECGMGLWLARQLCDQIDMMTHPWGFLVRLVSRR